jgi:hypothetical protein
MKKSKPRLAVNRRVLRHAFSEAVAMLGSVNGNPEDPEDYRAAADHVARVKKELAECQKGVLAALDLADAVPDGDECRVIIQALQRELRVSPAERAETLSTLRTVLAKVRLLAAAGGRKGGVPAPAVPAKWKWDFSPRRGGKKK